MVDHSYVIDILGLSDTISYGPAEGQSLAKVRQGLLRLS
jgi:hypothetical protein